MYLFTEETFRRCNGDFDFDVVGQVLLSRRSGGEDKTDGSQYFARGVELSP
jgi:hypothetical protein